MKGIRAVLFDAGATLIRPEPPVEIVYGRELARDGAAFTEEDLARALTRSWEEVHREAIPGRYGGVRGESDFWRSFVGRVRKALDGGVVSEDAFQRVTAHFRDPGSWFIYPDVTRTLDALEKWGYRLGVVSNWDSSLPALLEDLGLARRFQTIVVSAVEEVGKPDAEIFRRACARLQIAPGEALHVGDALREDYEGARGAGLQALLLDRQDRHDVSGGKIRTLGEIVDLLAAR
ncbi:MAG: HAD-IA family hydrolase [Thermoanaerobaculia bacterium]